MVKHASLFCWLGAAALFPTGAGAGEEPRPLIQIAIFLDTSTSMEGLISQAQARLWKVVNEFAYARREGAVPDLRVALYEYGKNTLPPAAGFARRVLPLTNDLDKVSEELFQLTTRVPVSGSQEYCGLAIQSAVQELAWSGSNNDLKTIFIAGNEPFDQGPVDFRDSCKAAAARGICVNTIYCGSEADGIATFWKDGALLADGSYMAIDQNRLVLDVPAPQDKEIARLGVELNRTYVPYGVNGLDSRDRQTAQDRNSQSLGTGNLSQRAVSKASQNYRNSSWDLVDALREKNVKLEELKKDVLPEALRKLTLEELKAHLEARAREREGIQKQIQQLDSERQKFLAGEQNKQAASQVHNLDSAMIQLLREQAEKKKFTLKDSRSSQETSRNKVTRIF